MRFERLVVHYRALLQLHVLDWGFKGVTRVVNLWVVLLCVKNFRRLTSGRLQF
jgi:hypothetical protein